MALDLSIPSQLSLAYLPDLVLIGGALLLLLFAVWSPDSPKHAGRVASLALGLTVLTAIAVAAVAGSGRTATNGVIAVDGFRWGIDIVVLLGTAMTIALTRDWNLRRGITSGEPYVLLLLSASGMMLLAAARDLMLVFLGIEVMSIAVYVLAGMDRRSARSAESSLKYFLLGAFSSAFLLYGIALVYGATGSTNLATIGERLRDPVVAGSGMLAPGLALLLVGFAFKVAAAPFHMWTPDVYDGAPSPFTGFMSAAVKAASFAALVRVALEAVGPGNARWHLAVWWLAALTMIIGNLFAVRQRNLKRLLAYSSIAHAGFLLVAVAAQTPTGAAAIVFYLVAYTLATIGAFAVIVSLSRGEDRELGVGEYEGLFQERPGLAIAMAVFMLALLGFPLAGGMGFFAKYYVVLAAIEAPAPQRNLAIILVLTTVVSASFYLYVVMVMFMRPRPADALPLPPAPPMTRLVIGFAVVAILALGLYPSPVVRLVRGTATASFLPQPGGAPTAAPAPGRVAATR